VTCFKWQGDDIDARIPGVATIVLHGPSNTKGVLVASGYGMYRASQPSLFWGSFSPDVDEGTQPMLAVCDADGAIRWGLASEFTVVSVDGKPPAALLSEDAPYR